MGVPTGDDFELVDVADLWAVPECLAAHAGVGERPADGEVQVVGPRARSKPVLERLPEQVYPELAAGDIGVGDLASAGEDPRGGGLEGAHLDDDSSRGLCLAMEGVATASGGNGELRAAAHAEDVAHGGGDVGGRLGVEDARRREAVAVAEVSAGVVEVVEGEGVPQGEGDVVGVRGVHGEAAEKQRGGELQEAEERWRRLHGCGRVSE